MNFVYPLGLLGLIGIPVLIIIYIIKNKYTEQTVTSTYLWTLSERFLKRKNPLNKITGIIALLLQILAVLFISLGIAHPYFVLKDVANEYCFILDASGSMAFTEDGVSSFDKGKGKIAEYIEQSIDGSKYTLVCVGDTAVTVYEQLEDKDRALELLGQAQVFHTGSNLDKAMEIAQRRFDENTSLKTYFITDGEYEVKNNVTLVNVAYHTENYYLQDFTYVKSATDGYLTGTVYASQPAELTVELYLNGGEEVFKTETVTIAEGESQKQFSVLCEGTVVSAIAKLTNEDSMMLDNTATYYSKEEQQAYDVLIVSEKPFFLQSALSALGYSSVEVVAPKNYQGEGNYDLYIFDAYTPAQMPRYGVVWLMALDSDLDKSGFSIYGQVDLLDGGKLEISTSSNSTVKKLTQNLTGDDVYINKYRKYGALQASCDFRTVYEYKSSPMVFMGKNEYGNKEVVFAFDLHDSNFPLTVDYTVLMYNLLNESFPEILEKTAYYCGERLEMNVSADCRHLEIYSPSGKVELKSPKTVDSYTFTETGVYKIIMKTSTDSNTYYVSANLAKTENTQNAVNAYVGVYGTATEGGIDGKWDKLLWFFVALGVFFVADWVVYCYDKYQLR